MATAASGYDRATTGLFRVAPGGPELQVSIGDGHLIASMSGPDLEAFGRAPATLVQLSRHSTTLTAALTLRGYDLVADRFSRYDVTITAGWTVDRSGSGAVELSGMALVNEVGTEGLVRLPAVRHHPYNQMRPVADPEPAYKTIIEPVPASIRLPL